MMMFRENRILYLTTQDYFDMVCEKLSACACSALTEWENLPSKNGIRSLTEEKEKWKKE